MHACLHACIMHVYMLQVQKLGYETYVAVCAWWGEGNRVGTLEDVQVSQHDSTAYA